MTSGRTYRVRRSTRASRIAGIIAAVVLVILATAPLWAGRADMRLIVEICYFLALAEMWNLLAGYAGLVSVGQQAFVGLGGYCFFVLAIHAGLPPLLAVVVAGVLSALIAAPTALVVFRLRGAYFAIGTWVVAEVFRLGFAQVSVLGGGSGKSLPAAVVKGIADDSATREALIYLTGLGIAVGAIVLVYLLLRSRYGLALTAIRDSEPAAGSLGVNTFGTKLGVYLLAAFVTGLVGALVFLQKLRISPDAAFDVTDWTANVIFMVVIGGIGTIEGPIVGTLIFFALRAVLADYGSLYMVLLGTLAIVIMLKARQGLWGLVSEKLDLHLFPVHRRLDLDPDPKR